MRISTPVCFFTHRALSLGSSDVMRVCGHWVCRLAHFSLRLPCCFTVGEVVDDTVCSYQLNALFLVPVVLGMIFSVLVKIIP